MLECPQCGSPEITRKRLDGKLWVLFGCMLAVTLPGDVDDVELQHRLDEWKRTGGLERWLKQPLFSPGTDLVVITDKEIVKKAKEHFDELWKKGKKITEEEEKT